MNTAPIMNGPRHRPNDPRTPPPMNRSVLYIEDDPNNIRLVERLLHKRRPDTELHVATTGRDGITAAISEHPALILLDNRLPDATGAEVLRQLTSAEATTAIPVVIVSGDTGKAIATELLTTGAAGFLVKPYDIHKLMAIIDRHLP
jgi:CheY-like chemotaxis protein